MKKIYLILLLNSILLLNGCQSPAEDGRETVYKIYEAHSYIDMESVSVPEDFYYSGFSSYTTASEDGFKLVLLKDDIYSELIIEWDDFTNEEVTINLIQIIYYDFESDQYFLLESEEDDFVYEGYNYDSIVKNLSSIRIDDIQWIIENLGYEYE